MNFKKLNYMQKHILYHISSWNYFLIGNIVEASEGSQFRHYIQTGFK